MDRLLLHQDLVYPEHIEPLHIRRGTNRRRRDHGTNGSIYDANADGYFRVVVEFHFSCCSRAVGSWVITDVGALGCHKPDSSGMAAS